MNTTKQFILLISLIFFCFTTNAQWNQIGLDIDGEANGDLSGRSVSMTDDGLTVAIGSPYNDGNGIEAGHVRVYKFISGIWTQQGADIDGEAAGDRSGHSVSISTDGLTVAIGAIDNGGNGNYSGHVRIYKFISGVWVQQGVDIDGEAVNDVSGWSVSLSSDGLTVAIGAVSNAGNGQFTNTGHVRVYKFISSLWTQQGADIDGEAAYEFCGHSVSISADGLTVAIGANRNSENATYVGQVRVYKLMSGIWTQQGADINGDIAGDQTGSSVSISADGLTIAIGSLGESTQELGYVRLYKLTNLGTDENNFGNSFTIYPNPTSGQLSIALGEVYNNIIIKLTDVRGQLIDKQIFQSTNQIDYAISGKEGVYFIELSSNKGEKTTIKIIKQ